jgi:hypothetical protein
VVQLTLLALAVFLTRLAVDSWSLLSDPNAAIDLGQVVFLGTAAVLCASGAFWMGFRTVRGPQPPSLE